jgi:glycolate oxidase FAD binding subunit
MTALVESIESAADVQAGDIAASLGGTVSDQLPAGLGRRPWPDDGRVGVKVTHRLGALRTALDAVDELVPDAVVRAQVGSGVLWLSTDRTDVGWLEPLRVRVADLDGQVVVVEAPAEVKQAIDTWGPVRGLALMRRIKDQFDPDHRMAPGCFVGGI